MIPGAANPLLLTSTAGAAGYQIERSIRLNAPDSAYLSRTPSVAGNRKTWTWAGWVKQSKLGTFRRIFTRRIDSNNQFSIFMSSGNVLQLQNIVSGAANASLTTSQVFRDSSAWLHLVAQIDTTQATASNRLKFYINGAQITQFSASTYPSQNLDLLVNANALHEIGAIAGTETFDGYLADVHFIDGQALDPTSFGEFDANGVWQPIAYTGSHPGNSFHLDFADNSAATTAGIGKDVSGNGNDWTPVNLSVAAGAGNDSLVDTPTNYGVDDGLGGSVRGNYATLNPLDGSPGGLSNGNLDAASANAYPTIIPGSGQWYYEVNGTGYQWDGIRANWTPRAGSHNFGQRAWASSAPSGFKALCTTNLPEPLVAKPSEVMDVKLYTGNGGTQTISGLGFSPDLVWVKNRAAADNHKLLDTVRGATNELESNTTDAEVANADGLTAFNSDGFDLGADVEYNTSSEAYVAWTWDAGSSTVTNNDGSITSQVRANPSAGFSIVTYTGTGVNATVGHGLGVAPGMIIVKRRDTTGIWHVYHSSLTSSGYFLTLNNTDKELGPGDGIWNLTPPTSTVFSIGNNGGVNGSGGTYVAYCFAPVASYSAFGSYVGNGSADGPFVFTGMRPRWVMIKCSSSGGANLGWFIYDTERDNFNVGYRILTANSSGAETVATGGTYTDMYLDILSCGFKVRTNYASHNGNASTYVWAAFAEHPFQYARAR